MTGRLERLRAGLAERGWHGALVTPGASFRYLTGIDARRTERLTCLGVPAAGDPWLIAPAFEAPHLETTIAGAEVEGWGETADPFAAVARRVRVGDVWAIEPSTAYHDVTRLAARTEADLVDGADLFESLRRHKDAAEIDALRRAIKVAWEVYDDVAHSLTDGDTEAAVADRFSEGFRVRGAEAWALVQFGATSASPHAEAGTARLSPGTAVLFDWGGWLDGYSADITRAFWWDGGIAAIEAAPEEYRAVHQLVRDAQHAGIEAVAPGVEAGRVDAAARALIRRAGYGDAFTHRLGHGLGLELHEPPYLVSGSSVPLAPGDVFTVEPGVYLPGRFGVRWEDVVHLTERGPEILTRRF